MNLTSLQQSNATIFMRIKENEEEPEITLNDIDDQCMKIAVESFELLTKSIPQAVFHLRNLDSIAIKYIKEDGTEIIPSVNKNLTIVGTAADSILAHLDNAGYVGKHNVLFTASGSTRIFQPSFISVNNKATESDSIDNEKGIVSYCHASLVTRQLCIFFNEQKPEIFQKIQGVLATIFSTKTSSALRSSA